MVPRDGSTEKHKGDTKSGESTNFRSDGGVSENATGVLVATEQESDKEQGDDPVVHFAGVEQEKCGGSGLLRIGGEGDKSAKTVCVPWGSAFSLDPGKLVLPEVETAWCKGTLC